MSFEKKFTDQLIEKCFCILSQHCTQTIIEESTKVRPRI